MAWTPTIIETVKGDGSVMVNVSFTDGTQTVGRNYVLSNGNIDSLKSLIREEVLRLNATSDFTVENGAIDITPPVKNVPSAFDVWLRNYGRLQTIQTLISLGVLTGNETPVTNLRNTVKTTFQASFVDQL